MRNWVRLTIAILLLPSFALAGVNAGGTLVVHGAPDVVYCSDHGGYRGQAGLSGGCASLNGTLPSGEGMSHVWWVVAAFPPSGSPRLKGVEFGVDYDPGAIVLVDWGKCGDFELPQAQWPDPQTGLALIWDHPQFDHLVEVYWFAGYGYASRDVGFRTTGYPQHGGNFADDSLPAQLDPIADFGSLGFGHNLGYLPCPEEIGACCLSDGSCSLQTHADCAGVWRGSGVACDSDPCDLAACCLPDGSCRLTSSSDCAAQGGTGQGSYSSCEPQPCSVQGGACCLPGGTCQVMTVAGCAGANGEYVCNGSLCEPSPCGRPAYTLAPDGSGDLPTIQAAVNAAEDGGVISLLDGTFTGVGNRDVNFLGKAITIRSQSENAEACVIDCEGLSRGFQFDTGESPASILRDLTVTRGRGAEGGAVRAAGASPRILGCRFTGNSATTYGGAVYADPGTIVLEGCTFANNTAGFGGGGVFGSGGAELTVRRCLFHDNQAVGSNAGGGAIAVIYTGPLLLEECTIWRNTAAFEGGGIYFGDTGGTSSFTSCTIVGNTAPEGSAVYAHSVQPFLLSIKNTIIASNLNGASIDCGGGVVTVSCSDVYGNAGGNYVSCIDGQSGLRGNISQDPLFCDAVNGQFELRPGSPCLPKPWATVSSCGLIGAKGRGCTVPRPQGAEITPADALALTPRANLLGAIHPNPSTGQIEFALTLGRPSSVRIELIDVSGRALRRLVDQSFEAGTYNFDERMIDASNQELPAGIYYLSLNDGRSRTVRKLVLIR